MDYFTVKYPSSGDKTVALEDGIMEKDKPVSAGSKIMEHFISPIGAEVADRLAARGYAVAGRTPMHEFGVPDLFSDRFETAGQTPGAVTAVAEGAAGFALTNDVFGVYRKHAAERGCCYIHPTYGTVSRYGLVPAVSSMDQIGVVCNDLAEGFKLLSCIAGRDGKDGAMFPDTGYDYFKPAGTLKIGVPGQIMEKTDDRSRAAVNEFIKNFETVEMEIEYFDMARQVMYILCCAELYGNVGRYDGIKFGHRADNCKNLEELYYKTRSCFGTDVKTAAIAGAMALSSDHYVRYYEKAMRTRRLVKEALTFDTYDVVVLPCAIDGGPYENLSLYAPAPLAGLPSVSFNYMGSGMQLIAGVKNEHKLLAAWKTAGINKSDNSKTRGNGVAV